MSHIEQTPFDPAAPIVAGAMLEALAHHRVNDAERLLAELCELDPRVRPLKIYPLIIAIQRGNVVDAYRELQSEGEHHHPELQALCLFHMGDPMWESMAERAEASAREPYVRSAMRQLLGRERRPTAAA